MNKITEKPSESAVSVLTQAGLRCTPGRIAIINLLRSSVIPVSQPEICRLLKDVNINRVSIYRSLNAFRLAGIVHRMAGSDRTWRFMLCRQGCRGRRHPHFICRRCGKIECLGECLLPEIAGLQPGYVVEEQEVYLRGLCAGCSS